MLLDKWRKNKDRVRQAGAIARERARTAGGPAYYRDASIGDGLVKEMPDGRRVLVDEADDFLDDVERTKLYREACQRLDTALEAVAPKLAGHTEGEDYDDAVVLEPSLPTLK